MLLISSCGYLCGWLKVRRGMRTGDTRKIFHFAIFTCAGVLSLTLGVGAVNLLGGLMTFYIITLVQIGEGSLLYEGLARETDHPHRSRYIVIPFLATAAGGILSVLLFGPMATVGIVASGWGDAIAEPVGIRFGRHPYRVLNLGGGVKSHRTLEGSVAVLLATFAGVALAITAGDLAPGRSPFRLLLAVACIALASALVEAVSHHGADNLTLPLTASGLAYALL